MLLIRRGPVETKRIARFRGKSSLPVLGQHPPYQLIRALPVYRHSGLVLNSVGFVGDCDAERFAPSSRPLVERLISA